MGSLFNNLGLKIFDGASAQIQGAVINKLNKGLLNGGFKSSEVRFYYNEKMGGSITKVLTKSLVGQAAKALTDEALSAYHKLLFKDGKLAKHTSNTQKLIENGNMVDDAYQYQGNNIMKAKYGVMKVNNGKNVVVATDMYGNRCVDSVMLAIPLKNPVEFKQRWQDDSPNTDGYNDNSFSTDTLVWWDCTAIVTVSSEKNIIATKVNGRDYSRKELISNGDINISVTGRLNSFLADVYPTDDFQKFIQIMKYKGAVKVNSQILSQFGIDRILIQNFNMPQKTGYKNIQEYTFSAIGLQPDIETKVSHDTITTIDSVIMSEEKEKSPWQKILDDRVNGLKKASEDIASQSLSMASGILENSL